MRIINAEWEKRNIGVNTVEIIIEDDTIQDFEKAIESEQVSVADYIVLKIPSHKIDVCWCAQKKGFLYVEDMIHMVSELKETEKKSPFYRMQEKVTCDLLDESELKKVLYEVENGLFGTDRISSDPVFGKEVAGKRYAGWLMDEWERGTKFYKYEYKGTMIGFFTLRECEKGIYISTLGGIFQDARKGGIGAINKVPQVVKELGGKRLIGDVSSNNPMQVRALSYAGYHVQSINHIFVMHK